MLQVTRQFLLGYFHSRLAALSPDNKNCQWLLLLRASGIVLNTNY
jgi:hypothetical protein